MMHGITIVCGLPGTGKSTLARALAESIEAVHLNTDRIRHALGRQGKYSENAKTEIYDHLLDATSDVVTSGRHVVVDGTFYKAALREKFTSLAVKINVAIHWIEIMASEETIRQRVSQERPYTEADYAVYLKVRDVFEPLATAHLTLDSDVLDLDEMVHRARQFIQSTG